MRVLHIYKTYLTDSFGGVEQVIYQLCRKTKPLGVTNKILSLSLNPNPKILMREEGEVHRFPVNFEISSSSFSLSAVNGFRHLTKWADIIHYHFPWPFADMMHLLVSPKTPSILTYHADIVRQKILLQFYRPLMHFFLGKMDTIVASSPNYLITSPVLQTYQDKTRVIAFGLDQKSYPIPDNDTLEYWKTYFQGKKFFLFVGVLRYYKGLHILLDAIRNANFLVVIVGAGPMEQALKQQAQNLGIRNVCFLGKLEEEDKTALLMLCHAFVLPSHLRTEAFGMSLLESAMFGKPMVTAEINTGSSFINVHNETGLIVPPNDSQALNKALEYLYENDDIAFSMGAKAKIRYDTMFTADKMAERYTALYEELL